MSWKNLPCENGCGDLSEYQCPKCERTFCEQCLKTWSKDDKLQCPDCNVTMRYMD